MRQVGWLVALGAIVAQPALAQIKVGITVSATGPAASLGVPERNTVAMLPTQLAGQSVTYIVLDDGTDPTRAVANARKLIDEDKVDLLIGSTATPGSLAMIDVAGDNKVPMISLAASERIVAPVEGNRRWVFKTPQNDSLMARAVIGHMAGAGIKTIAFIGFADAYGDGWLAETQKAADAAGIKLVAVERFARNDQSVLGQVLKLLKEKPDAVLVAGAGTPAALPQKTLRERGYTAPIYQTHGVANQDFLRVGGKDLEGTVLPAGPVLVGSQLPETNPIKQVATDLVAAYEKAYGEGTFSTFAAHMFDAGLEFSTAVPVALQTAKPGTPAFRSALRDAIEGEHGVVISHGIVTMSATDHNGLDERARVMVVVKDGNWILQK